ncbi:hypothetical protein TSUD_14340 [Trifolium subterraneum]|uniref:Uncharacterized protein n=1 Tax=Trifolium subterraneum TaxID=3900 RepID=A0A2Z6P9J4_TRISU|nr:hypothetical protein TSUD_14340 [Trifolium subterraneum]
MKWSRQKNAARHALRVKGNRNNTHKTLLVDQVADEDLEWSVLFAWHMQSGHGKLYMESMGLLSSTALESLCDLMLCN